MWMVLTKNFMFECVLECARAQTDENWVWLRCFILTEWHDTEAGVSTQHPAATAGPGHGQGRGWNSLTFGRPISSSATVPRCQWTPGLGRKVWNATLWSVCTVYTTNPRTHIRELAQHSVPLMVHNSSWGRDEAFECNVRFSNADFIKMLLQSITSF